MTKLNQNDEALLVDFLMGQCNPAQQKAVRARLESDAEFQAHHDNLSGVLKAVSLLPQLEAPEDLLETTLYRISQKQQTDALLLRESRKHPARVMFRFSLRDAVAVAAVLVLMACVFVPTFRQASRLAETGRCAAQEGYLGAALAAYANSNRDYLPFADNNARRWLPAASHNNVSNSQALFKLVAGGYVSPSAFQCPAVSSSVTPFAVSAGMVDFPRGDIVSYSYQHTLGSYALRRSDRMLNAVADSMAILADSTPLFEDGQFQRDSDLDSPDLNSNNHQKTGQTVLYLDGHVQWSDTPAAGVMDNNIYLAEGVYDYRGDETPAGPTDSFLLPAYSCRR